MLQFQLRTYIFNNYKKLIISIYPSGFFIQLKSSLLNTITFLLLLYYYHFIVL